MDLGERVRSWPYVVRAVILGTIVALPFTVGIALSTGSVARSVFIFVVTFVLMQIAIVIGYLWPATRHRFALSKRLRDSSNASEES